MAQAAFAVASLKPATTRSPSFAANVCLRSSAVLQLTRTTACQVAPLTMGLKTWAKQQAARVSAVCGAACGALDRCTVEASATRVGWRLHDIDRAGARDRVVHAKHCLEARGFGTCELMLTMPSMCIFSLAIDLSFSYVLVHDPLCPDRVRH